MSDSGQAEYYERLMDGKLLLYTRNGIYQARVYTNDRRYLHRSLRTRDLNTARNEALRVFYEIEFKKDQGLPLRSRSFSAVLDEYLAMREKQASDVAYKNKDGVRRNSTSPHMLRQIQRVSKFWHEYCGKRSVDTVDDKVLQGYVDWRRAYYKNMPAEKRPRNAKLNPAAKTLEWETTFALTVIKFAHERGYRANKPLPRYRYKAARGVSRPAFTIYEYRRLYQAMRRWIWDKADNERHQYTRELLRDYVLILANSGIRVGEANNLRVSDIVPTRDEHGNRSYALTVNGKTGQRYVVPRANAARYFERVLERNQRWQKTWAEDKQRGLKANGRKQVEHGDWFFRMADGHKVVTLIDQFNTVLERADSTHNADGEKYSLYSLRHFYAVQMLRSGRVNAFDLARNMGTSVQIIEDYYGRHATAKELAARLSQ